MELEARKIVCLACVRSAMMKDLAFLLLTNYVVSAIRVNLRLKLAYSLAVVMSSTQTVFISF